MESPLIITSPTAKGKPEVDRTKDPQSNPIPRPERPPSPSLTKLVDIGLEDDDNDLERRNRLILQLQDEAMQYAKENKNLRLENHKLKQHNAWMKERLKYTGNTGRIKLENDVDVVLRENASLKAQIYDLKGEITDYKQLEKKRVTMKDQTTLIRTRRNYVLQQIKVKTDLLQVSLAKLKQNHAAKQARAETLKNVMGLTYSRIQKEKQESSRGIRHIEKELQLFDDVQSFLNLVLDAYHNLILHQEKVRVKMNEESLLKTGRINSLTRLAHVRKHGVLMGFQQSLEANELSQTYNKYNEKGNVMLKKNASATSLELLKEKLSESSVESSPAQWKRCYKCSMYNSVKAIVCAHCKSEYLELISIPAKQEN